jgi:zinc transporter ZupT
MELAATFAVALVFALIHFAGARFDFLRTVPRSIWLSAAGGVSVAYVFVHILPDLAEHQSGIERVAHGGLLAALEHHVWLVALAGLCAFYGLDRLARRRRTDSSAVFWSHLGSFALYNLLVGYLLVRREGALLFYGVALGLHFLVNDQGLREHHGEAYRRYGRWLLGPAPLAGWLIGVAVAVPPLLLSALFAFLAGGMVLNVLKEELPEDRESNFAAFAAGAGGYAALLLAAG